MKDAPFFSDATLRFFQQLRRHNNRDWFNAHKDVYLKDAYEPMVAVCESVGAALADFASHHKKPARKAILRIQENVRFHPNKPPYKKHLAAWWGKAGMPRTSGAGYYFHISSTEVALGAGCFMPTGPQQLAIRTAIAHNPRPLRKWLAEKRFRSLWPDFTGHEMAGTPRGFSKSDPAIDLLRCRTWGFHVDLPAEFALSAKFLNEILKRFRMAASFVEFLNAPLQSLPKRHESLLL